jgi:hypothetical protein
MSSSSTRAVLDKLAGIKQAEIKPCAVCKKGVAHDGNILFWRIKLERAGLHMPALARQHWLELMIGSPAVARAMGPDSDIAKVIDGPHDVWICEPCVSDKLHALFFIAEEISSLAAAEPSDVAVKPS